VAASERRGALESYAHGLAGGGVGELVDWNCGIMINNDVLIFTLGGSAGGFTRNLVSVT
jgi:hypothetical protein